MMPAALRSLLVATERHGLHAAVMSSRLLSRSAAGSSTTLPTFGSWLRTTSTAACLRASCFAADAVQDSTEGAERVEEEKRDSWLELPSENTAKRTRYSVTSDAGGSKPEDRSAEESVRHEEASASGELHHLDEQEGSDDEEQLSKLDWSDAEEPGGEERQTRFFPRTKHRKLKWPREKEREGIGAPAVVPPLPRFDLMLPRLEAYKAKFGDCLVPRRYWEDIELGDWTYRIRLVMKDKVLSMRQFEALDKLGFPWNVPVEVASWEFMYHEMRRYKEEFGHLDVPFKWKDPMGDFNNHFSRWFHAQPTLFLQRRLRPDQVRKLMIAGYDLREVTGDFIGKADYIAAQQEVALSSNRNEFEIMFAELQAWKAAYYTTIVPRMVYDNPVLGMWAWKVRRDYRQSKLAQWKIDRLNEVEFLWKPDAQSTKWHHNLHEARRYKEVHGTGHIPEDYKNPAEPGWVEAARWLQRQAKLFRKQKLTDKRYRIIREVLGIKFVRQYAPRVKQNRKSMGIQVESKKKTGPRYAAPIRKNVLI